MAETDSLIGLVDETVLSCGIEEEEMIHGIFRLLEVALLLPTSSSNGCVDTRHPCHTVSPPAAALNPPVT